MSSLRACRACLRGTGTLFPLDNALLRHFYRLVELQTLAEEEKYGVACVMCRGCLGALRGAMRLRASALRARRLQCGGLPPPPLEPPWPGLGCSGPVLLNSRDREVVLPGPNMGLFILFESDSLYDEKMDPDGPDGSYEPDKPEGTLGLDQPPGLGLEDTKELESTADVKLEIKEEHVTSLVKKEEFDSLDDLPLADLPMDDLPLDDLPLDDLPLALEAVQWDQKRKHRKHKERRRKTEGKSKKEGKLKVDGGSNKRTERRHKTKGKSRTQDKGKSRTQDKGKKKGASRMVLETDEYTVIKLDMAEVEAARQATLVSPRFLSAPHRCEACAKAFNYPDVLAAHALRHRPAPFALECQLCHQFLPSAVSLRGHLKSHTTKYKCKQCGFIKASRQDLLEHFALQHTSSPRTYVCNVCNKTLTKRTMFQKHMRVHFPSNKVTCDKCGKLFKTIETLRAHMLRHADVARYPCSQCPKAFRYASLLYSHKVTHLTSQDFYCVECDLRFKTASNLRLHLRKTKAHADSSKMEFACDQCARRFAAQKQLKAHVAWVHLGLREYECPLCQKQFGTRDGLRSHHRKIHDGIRPERSHLCHFCNKAFRAKAVLVKHLRVHTGERPFSCLDCGKMFAQDSTLNTHVRLVHLKLQRTKHSL